MEQSLEIIKALLQLVAQAQFTNDVEGARKITMITQAAAQFVQEQESKNESQPALEDVTDQSD